MIVQKNCKNMLSNRQLFLSFVYKFSRSCSLAVGILIVLGASASHGEEREYGMLSIEWLVDESDVIAVVRVKQSPKEYTVLRTIKGKPESIDWSVVRFEKRVGFFEPPSLGSFREDDGERARLLFVRGKGELLQSVSLERSDFIESVNKTTHPDYKPYPRLGVETKLYGVNQFGELLLSESKLFRAIEDRMKTVCEPVLLRAGVGKYLGGEGELSARYADDSFPLNNDDEIYYLVVPYDTGRRDYFLSQLLNGDAAEKLYAIRELAVLKDEVAWKAIEQAATCNEAAEVFHFDKNSGEVVAWTAADVRVAAQAELKKRP